MIIVDEAYLSDDLLNVCFSCDLSACKGACCVEGDEGAPLTEEEISLLEDEIDYIKPYMNTEGIAVIEELGVFDYGSSGEYVTPLVNHRECAFVVFENEIALCAIEKAYRDGKTKFVKPVSCHLYPIRIKTYATFDAVNYHKWEICGDALKKGKKEKNPLYVELKEPLIRKYGKDWYKNLLLELKNDKKA
jgi:hypothetical protein